MGFIVIILEYSDDLGVNSLYDLLNFGFQQKTQLLYSNYTDYISIYQ